jgi:hypothetical protein
MCLCQTDHSTYQELAEAIELNKLRIYQEFAEKEHLLETQNHAARVSGRLAIMGRLR